MGRHGDDDHDGLINRLDPDSPEYEGDAPAARYLSRAASGGGLSGSVIRAALAAVGAVGKQIVSFDELAAGAVDALRQAPAGLTKEGAAAFLATCAVESAWFRTTTEYGSGQRYAPYIGRTFVQLTWKENYAGFGRWCRNKGLVDDQDVFVNNPASLSKLRWAWLGAVYYFEVHGLWRYGNAGDFRAVSQAVNGGDGRIHTSFTPNSWAERQAMYRVFLNAGDALLPAPAAPPRPKGLPEMIERELVPGHNTGTVICPTGRASGLVDAAWVSVRAAGGARGAVWFQVSSDSDGPAPGAGEPWQFTLHSARRGWAPIPDGTEYIEYALDAAGTGSLLIEMRAR